MKLCARFGLVWKMPRLLTEIWNKIWEERRLAEMPFSNRGAIVIRIGTGPIFEKPIIVRFKHAGNISQGPIMPQVVRNWSCRSLTARPTLREDNVSWFPDNGEHHEDDTLTTQIRILGLCAICGVWNLFTNCRWLKSSERIPDGDESSLMVSMLLQVMRMMMMMMMMSSLCHKRHIHYLNHPLPAHSQANHESFWVLLDTSWGLNWINWNESQWVKLPHDRLNLLLVNFTFRIFSVS